MNCDDSLSSKLGKMLIIGGGKMGQAMLAGMISSNKIDPKDITVANPSQQKRDLIEKKYAVKCVEDATLADSADTIILAVKPQILRDVLQKLVDENIALGQKFAPKRIISVAAGITTETIASYFGEAAEVAIIRAMPNTPMMVGRGMIGVSVGKDTSQEEGELACELFSTTGSAVLVDEKLQDSVVAISGSGPAYFALFASELAKAGEKLGLPADLALELSLKTMAGTSELLEKTDQTPQQLIEQVSSPGGTTLAALSSFEESNISEVIFKAVMACADRSRELS